ncbi:MAG: hypothetical protein WKG07_22900 [Hymenobacter sp.]
MRALNWRLVATANALYGGLSGLQPAQTIRRAGPPAGSLPTLGNSALRGGGLRLREHPEVHSG